MVGTVCVALYVVGARLLFDVSWLCAFHHNLELMYVTHQSRWENETT